MRIALAQMKNQGSVEANLNQSIEWMREAAEHGTDPFTNTCFLL